MNTCAPASGARVVASTTCPRRVARSWACARGAPIPTSRTARNNPRAASDHPVRTRASVYPCGMTDDRMRIPPVVPWWARGARGEERYGDRDRGVDDGPTHPDAPVRGQAWRDYGSRTEAGARSSDG